jgi:glutamine cyclotransferase
MNCDRPGARRIGSLLVLLLALAASGCATSAAPPTASLTPMGAPFQIDRARVVGQTVIPVYGYKVVATYPHDTNSYTEGLLMQGGSMYEGAGLYGVSRLRQYELATGRVIHEEALDKEYFGEGITILDGTIYQLTYLSNMGFTYDQKIFARRGSFRYLTQGWGLTTDGHRLLMSNGSSSILFLNPKTLAVEGSVFVSDDVGPVGFLNELEYADGKLYANVWQSDFIAIIAPGSGKIIGWIDLAGLNPDPTLLKYPYVLNGIAINEATGRLLVTGKRWPAIYEIELVKR